MKCPMCDGTGKMEIGVGAFTIHGADCDQCNGKGVIEPMTNEEYLKQCNTEQLAEHLLNVWMDGAFNVNAEFGLNEAQIENHKGYIVEWLKQPHTIKE